MFAQIMVLTVRKTGVLGLRHTPGHSLYGTGPWADARGSMTSAPIADPFAHGPHSSQMGGLQILIPFLTSSGQRSSTEKRQGVIGGPAEAA